MLRHISCGVALMALALAPQAVGQTRARQVSAPGIPRMPDRRPNLNGLWQAMTTAYWDLEDHSAQPGPLLQAGAIGAIPAGYGVVEGGAIPYKPEALAKKKENFANRLKLDPEVKCYMVGVPRSTYMPYPFQVIQGKDTIMIAYEFAGAVRVINMGKPSEAPTDSWMGWSNGRWEGETLVIDVTGLNDQTWFDRAGNYHS